MSVGTIAALAAACANPTKDYDDFQVGTKDVRAVEPTSPQSHDGGTACTTVPAGETPDFSMSGLPNADGLYFVAVDIVGDRILELNVFTPGGIHAIAALYGVDVAEIMIVDLERRVRLRAAYRTTFDPEAADVV